MADYAQGLPIRSEADGTDNRVQVKIVDFDNPGTQQASVDTDNAVKVLATGHDAGGANVPVLVSSTGQVHVVIDDADAEEVAVVEYDTQASVAAAASDTQTYTVTTAKTLLLKEIICAASARAKYEIKTGVAASETTKAVGFGTVAQPNVHFVFVEPIRVSGDDNVLVIRTNIDNQAQDVYSTIIGTEI